MTEYIERDAVVDLITRRYENPEICTQEINSIPTADVATVVHGRWIQVDSTKCCCSHCDIITLIAMYPHGDKNFCPNCGAKMDGE